MDRRHRTIQVDAVQRSRSPGCQSRGRTATEGFPASSPSSARSVALALKPAAAIRVRQNGRQQRTTFGMRTPAKDRRQVPRRRQRGVPAPDPVPRWGLSLQTARARCAAAQSRARDLKRLRPRRHRRQRVMGGRAPPRLNSASDGPATIRSRASAPPRPSSIRSEGGRSWGAAEGGSVGAENGSLKGSLRGGDLRHSSGAPLACKDAPNRAS